MATPAQLDAMARQAGFHDYATWSAYQRNRMAMQHGRAPAGGEPPRNFLQNLLEKIPGHPAMLLRYVSDQFNNATGQK